VIKPKVIYKLLLYKLMDTNWNKQTHWLDQGKGHNHV
jgi:hypothetical protein